MILVLFVACEYYSPKPKEETPLSSIYIRTSYPPGTPVILMKGDSVVVQGQIKSFQRATYWVSKKYGDYTVYLPSGEGCFKRTVEITVFDCPVIVIDDTISDVSYSCESCDSIASTGDTIIDVLTFKQPVSVVKDSKCLKLFSSGEVYAFYEDSLKYGDYTLIVGNDTSDIHLTIGSCKYIELP